MTPSFKTAYQRRWFRWLRLVSTRRELNIARRRYWSGAASRRLLLVVDRFVDFLKKRQRICTNRLIMEILGAKRKRLAQRDIKKRHISPAIWTRLR
ncbi:hypothetical protein F2Q69_00061880 [Brassica cretica]|uniref:Uncharacterized protein n=1 Tax=Brassica cretica TaxID=69181 RepID=A0A8S9RKK2_BRACR|nr:hypothetical protein F2Q69_00061880 [Brassica cretica]